jgi:copper homeostasis protein (lipoprotein)
MSMRRKHLVGLSLLVLVASSCVRDDDPVEQEAADTTTQPEAGAALPADKAASPDGHTSSNSLDWAGTYSGVLPCADCPGIETVVTLRSDGTYERSTFYIDGETPPQTGNGTFTWDETGNKIVLETGDDEIVKYQVGENQLFHLDRDGERITSELAAHYLLKKHLNDPAIEGKAWKLVELRGKPVDPGQPGREAVLTLHAEDSVASGNASCNTFSGKYAIKSGQRISFGRNMAVTMRACPDMSVESTFLEVLEMADNYSLGDDGGLSLNRARMAPLARFEVAEGN